MPPEPSEDASPVDSSPVDASPAESDAGDSSEQFKERSQKTDEDAHSIKSGKITVEPSLSLDSFNVKLNDAFEEIDGAPKKDLDAVGVLLGTDDTPNKARATDAPGRKEISFQKPTPQIAPVPYEMGPSESAPCPNPRVKANIVSRSVFSYMNDLVKLGYKRPLEMSDMWEVDPAIEAKQCCDNFSAGWGAEEARVKNLKDKKSGLPERPSLLRVFYVMFFAPMRTAGILKLFNDLVQLAVPIVFNLFITHLEEEDWTNESKNYGYYYALLLFGIMVIKTFIESNYFFIVTTVGVQVRNILIGSIYSKSLKMSSAARHRRSTGETVNIMQVDAQALEQLTLQLHFCWSGAVQIIGFSAQLIYYVGPSGLAGIVVMLLLVPLQKKLMIKGMILRKFSQQNADKRVKQVGEVLNGIRAVKMNAWEEAFQDTVKEMRRHELVDLRLIRFLRAITGVLFTISPVLVAVSTFIFYTAVAGKDLTPSTVFTALIVMGSLRFPLGMYPAVLNSLLMGLVSVRRIRSFLCEEEMESSIQFQLSTGGPTGTVAIKDGVFNWAGDPETQKLFLEEKAKTDARNAKMRKSKSTKALPGKEGEKGKKAGRMSKSTSTMSMQSVQSTKSDKKDDFCLGTASPINVDVPPGSLVGVIGPVGCGKSSLLSAMLGEMALTPDNVTGSVQVSGSVAFVPQSAWILNATLRDNILFGKPYSHAKYFAAIKSAELERDVEILPAGHDTEIGEKGVNLSGGQKQRVSIARAVYADADVYLLDDPLSALDSHVGHNVFHQCIIKTLKGKTRVLVTNQLQFLQDTDKILTMEAGSIVEQGTFLELMDKKGGFAELMEHHGMSKEQAEHKEEAPVATHVEDPKKETKGKLVDKEKKETGSVKKKVLLEYLKATDSFGLGIMVLFMFAGAMSALALSDWWLSYWSKATFRKDGDGKGLVFYLGLYCAISLSSGVFTFARQIGILFMSMRASANLHDEMFSAVLVCPTSFFDTTPVGRVIARFSRDIDVIDNSLADSISQCMMCIFQVTSSLVLIIIFLPVIVIIFVPLMVIYYFVMIYYRASSRELKRMDAISRSPIYSVFSETLMGLDTIRAYGRRQDFEKLMINRINSNGSAYFPLKTLERWIAIRLETIGAMIVGAAACLAVTQHGKIFVGILALVVYRASSLTGLLNFTVKSTVEAENQLTAVERLLEYIGSLPKEAPRILASDKDLPAKWPSKGEVTFDEVHMRYREGLEPALQGVVAEVREMEKVGVVGRTGAGKSSLMQVLFRLVELFKGKIVVDGVDISKVGLQTLRSRMGIVPQDPVLFSGTVRFNLDPFAKHPDHEMSEVLSQCGLAEAMSLDDPVSEYGGNFSAGQRQLLCMARCLLRKPKLLVLDEATSSVDYTTDQLIQKTIRECFQNCTVLTIAHRLQTIADSDRIMCFDSGKVQNFDTPAALLADASSVYHHLVDSSAFDQLTNPKQGQEPAVDSHKA